MPAQTNIVLNDGLTTPVARTFSVFGVRNGVADWAYKVVDLIAGYIRQSLAMEMPKKASDPVIHTFRHTHPTVVTETINGVSYQKVVRMTKVVCQVYAAPDATAAELKDVCAFVMPHWDRTWTQGFANQIINKDPTT